jgi:hypothetical protein
MLEWLGELTVNDRRRVIREAFGKVASTEVGMLVFAVMFEELFFFRPATNDEQRVLNNYAKYLLAEYFDENADSRMLEAMMGMRQKTSADVMEVTKNGD